METYIRRAHRIVERINELAAFSEDPDGITRTFGTPAFIKSRQQVQLWMQQAGIETRIDSIGNVRGRWLSKRPGAKTFVIASHIDTVKNAGKWDGTLGVIMGVDLVEQLARSPTLLPFDIELIAFSDEEGVRFHSTFLGSKVVAGSFDTELLDKPDSAGIRLKEAIETMQCKVAELRSDAIPANEWLGYFEIHIEQGPVLYEEKIPAAVVSAIAGQRRVEISFKGMAGHAGTVPMDRRQDALCCAAECIINIEKYALENQGLVATIGKLQICNAASNVIPGEVVCSLDVRSAEASILEGGYNNFRQLCDTICRNRDIELHWNLIQQTDPVECDRVLNELLFEAIRDAGCEVISLVSGAGHDAIPISAVAPIAMLFVRCFKGISHHPLEGVEIEDLEAALKISDNFIINLVKKYS